MVARRTFGFRAPGVIFGSGTTMLGSPGPGVVNVVVGLVVVVVVTVVVVLVEVGSVAVVALAQCL
jgi:hypothetical protein